MCRLLAMSRDHSGPLTQAEKYIFATHLVLSSRLNNGHGVGVAVNKTGGDWFKSGDSAEDIVFTEDWNKWWDSLNGAEFDTIIGHTRLASLDWRNTKATGGAYPTDHAHPHSYNSFTLAHNGKFEEYKTVAESLGIDLEQENLTDTGVFVRLLAEHNPDKFTDTGLINALKAVGEAEYSMIIQHDSTQRVFVVRGNRTLFAAKSNYGLLINTTPVNLTDLAKETKLGLQAFGCEPLVLEKPEDLEEYSLYRLEGGKIEKLRSFEGKVKDINAPKKTHSTVTTSGYWANRTATASDNSTEVSDAEEIGTRAMTVYGIRQLLPKVSDEHHRLALLELYGVDGGKYPTMHHFESEQLKEYIGMMYWAQEHLNLYNWTEAKQEAWAEFTQFMVEVTPEITTEKMYAEACHRASTQVDIPFFLNSQDVLDNLSEACL